MHVPRSQWIRVLTAHPPATIVGLADELTNGWQIHHQIVPQDGLALLPLRDSVFGEDFYLGEVPVASAWVQLISSSGQKMEGAAQVMGASAEVATALAVLDAIAANQAPGSERVWLAMERGMEVRQQEEQVRIAMLERTRVNFSTALTEEESD